jgi:hypothetical protein
MVNRTDYSPELNYENDMHETDISVGSTESPVSTITNIP